MRPPCTTVFSSSLSFSILTSLSFALSRSFLPNGLAGLSPACGMRGYESLVISQASSSSVRLSRGNPSEKLAVEVRGRVSITSSWGGDLQPQRGASHDGVWCGTNPDSIRWLLTHHGASMYTIRLVEPARRRRRQAEKYLYMDDELQLKVTSCPSHAFPSRTSLFEIRPRVSLLLLAFLLHSNLALSLAGAGRIGMLQHFQASEGRPYAVPQRIPDRGVGAGEGKAEHQRALFRPRQGPRRLLPGTCLTAVPCIRVSLLLLAVLLDSDLALLRSLSFRVLFRRICGYEQVFDKDFLDLVDASG